MQDSDRITIEISRADLRSLFELAHERACDWEHRLSMERDYYIGDAPESYYDQLTLAGVEASAASWRGIADRLRAAGY